MAVPLKEILVVGYGAVGAIYSLILKRSKLARITIVARGNYAATKAQGMTFRSQKYGNISNWQPDRLCASVAEAADRSYSHVFLTTKVIPEIQKTTELLSPFLTPSYTNKFPQPTYVLFQNGLNIEVELMNALRALNPTEEPKVVGASFYIGTRRVDNTTVEHSYFDRAQLGIYRTTPNVLSNTPEEIAVISSIGDVLKAGGTDVTIFPEIQRVKFEKNIWNVVFGPIAVLARNPLQSIFRPPQITVDNPDFDPTTMPHVKYGDATIPAASEYIAKNTIPFIWELLQEARNVGNAIFPPTEDGAVYTEKNIEGILQRTSFIASKPTSTERPSIFVDVESERPMEVEVLVGELVRIGRRLNVPIPRLEAIYAMLIVTQNELLRKSATSK